jgi:hypothetical protein
MSERTAQNSFSRYKSVALPAEHGGWGFLLEPMVAGLLVAPSWAGFWLCLSALGVFLIHQPLRIVVKDRLKGRRYERTRWAERFTSAYGGLAVLFFMLAWTQAEAQFWLPLVIAVLLSVVQLLYEGRNRGRELVPETFGALALGATAPSVVLSAGGTPEDAAVLWLLMALRTVPSLFYVRVRLRLQRGQTLQSWLPIAAHVLALLVVLALCLKGFAAWIALAAPLVLLARALYGLRPADAPVRARDIGIQEMIFGLLFAVLVALGVR